jgi:hypothetical protein
MMKVARRYDDQKMEEWRGLRHEPTVRLKDHLISIRSGAVELKRELMMDVVIAPKLLP